MARFTANFEVGTDGSKIQTSDAGSATAWNDIARGADGNSPTYSATQLYGFSRLSGKNATTVAGNDGGYFGWNQSILGSLTTTYGRFYVYLPNTTATYLVYGFNAADSVAWRVLLSGTFIMRDSTGTDVAIGSVAPTTNQWIRFEWKVVSSASVGICEFKLFNNPNAFYPTETVTSGSCNTLADTGRIRLGDPGTVSPASSTYYFDYIEVNDTGYPGADPGPAIRWQYIDYDYSGS